MSTPVKTAPTKAIVTAVFTVLLAVLATVQTAISDGQVTQAEVFVIIGSFLTAALATVSVYQTTNAPVGPA